MRHPLLLLAIACTAVGSAGCAAFHHLDEYTTSEARPVDGNAVVNGEDPAAPGAGVAPKSENPSTGCKSNRECTTIVNAGGTLSTGRAAPIPAVCVKATGKCEPLGSTECPRLYGDYTSDDAVVLGTLLGASDPETASPLERAALLAAEEINAASGGLPPLTPAGASRPLVVVGCNTGSGVLAATKHLVEQLHVAAIVGPLAGEDVVDVTQQVSAKGGTLLMTPASVASPISQLADEGLTWRTVPSDAQRARLVIEQMNELETLLRATRSLTTVKLGIVHATNVLGLSARDAISGKLILNGRFINDAANAANVSVDSYAPSDATSSAAIATRYATAFKPDIVFVTSADQVDGLVVPLEKALTAARAVLRPYYVFTDAAKSDQLLAAISSSALPADIKRRIRGIGVRPESNSVPVLADFDAAFAARYGSALPASAASSAAGSYDSMYAIAYAIAATADVPLDGASVAHGLRALGVGDPVTVGAKGIGQVIQSLATRKSVSLRGTFSAMQWDSSGDITSGTAEVWCIGGAATAPTFGSSGLTMDVQTQVVGGAFVQCQ
jgi:branched-chain amino acid transport system substrate-binding protein